MSFFNNHKVMVVRIAMGLIGTLVPSWLLSRFTRFGFVTWLVAIVAVAVVTWAVARYMRRPRPVPVNKPVVVRRDRSYGPMIVVTIVSAMLLVGAFVLRGALLTSALASNKLTAEATKAAASVVMIVAVGLVLLVLFVGIQTTREIRKRRPTQAQADMQISDNRHLVSLDRPTIDKLLHMMVPTDRFIHVATRKHPYSPLLQTIAPVHVKTIKIPDSDKERKKVYRNWWLFIGMCALVPGLPVLVSQVASRNPQISDSVVSLAYMAIVWFWTAVVLAFCYRFAINWVQWYSWYFVATEARTQPIILWPAWMYWADGRHPHLELTEIRWCEALDQDNWLSKLFKKYWGTVDVDGMSTRDGDLNAMTDMPYHSELHMTLLGLMKEAKKGQKSVI
jgi:hypothetical protein